MSTEQSESTEPGATAAPNGATPTTAASAAATQRGELVRTLPWYMGDWRIGAHETLMGMCVLQPGATRRRVMLANPRKEYL